MLFNIYLMSVIISFLLFLYTLKTLKIELDKDAIMVAISLCVIPVINTASICILLFSGILGNWVDKKQNKQ